MLKSPIAANETTSCDGLPICNTQMRPAQWSQNTGFTTPELCVGKSIHLECSKHLLLADKFHLSEDGKKEILF